MTTRVGVSDSPQQGVQWIAERSYNIESDHKIDVRASGRYLALRFQSASRKTGGRSLASTSTLERWLSDELPASSDYSRQRHDLRSWANRELQRVSRT